MDNKTPKEWALLFVYRYGLDNKYKKDAENISTGSELYKFAEKLYEHGHKSVSKPLRKIANYLSC